MWAWHLDLSWLGSFFWKLGYQVSFSKLKFIKNNMGGNFWRWWFVYGIECGDGFMDGYMLISKLIKLCALKMYSILYVIHMQIKWFKNIIRFRTIILLLNQDILIITFAVSKCFCTICASDEINATYEAII